MTDICQCPACDGVPFAHDSDCAVHNAPALPVGPCSCRDGDAPPEWAYFVFVALVAIWVAIVAGALVKSAAGNPRVVVAHTTPNPSERR